MGVNIGMRPTTFLAPNSPVVGTRSQLLRETGKLIRWLWWATFGAMIAAGLFDSLRLGLVLWVALVALETVRRVTLRVYARRGQVSRPTRDEAERAAREAVGEAQWLTRGDSRWGPWEEAKWREALAKAEPEAEMPVPWFLREPIGHGLVTALLGERARFARWCPALVAMIFFYYWLPADGDGFLAHLGIAVFVGVLFSGILFIVYFLTVLMLARIGGTDYDAGQLEPYDLRTTATLLLITLTYMLGTHWVNRKVAAIDACMHNNDFVLQWTPGEGSDVSNASRARASDLLQWCRDAQSEDAPFTESDDP
jgi:hypothetical protein